jgi:hypothetical protein
MRYPIQRASARAPAIPRARFRTCARRFRSTAARSISSFQAAATYPRDLFFGRSNNPYIDRHMNMDPGWLPPSQWIPRADADVPLVRPHWR